MTAIGTPTRGIALLELTTGIVVAIVALAAVLEPLLRNNAVHRPATAVADVQDDIVEIAESESPKIQALLALREIEFDRATGKLSETDYATLRQRYASQALEAIQEEQRAESGERDEEELDAKAEAAVARIKAQRGTPCPTCDHELEPGAVYCSRCGRSLLVADAAPRCWICGTDLPSNAKFCDHCGSALPEHTPAA